FLVHPDGSDLHKVSYSNMYCEQVSWSPFSAFLAGSCLLDGKWDIYVMGTAQGAFQNLTLNGFSKHPAWSPDGKWIAYDTSGPSSNMNDIYVMSANGDSVRRLTSNGRSWYPIWSPDSQSIAYTYVPADSDNELYLVDLSSGQSRPLTNNDVDDVHPSWSPDGKFIVYGNGDFVAVLKVSSGESLVLGLGRSPLWSPTVSSLPLVKALPDCTSGWSRLTAGGQARITGILGSPANRVRSAPLVGDNKIGDLLPGSTVSVYEGPVCADGLVFWQVANESIPGGYGWTAEGDGTEYWLEPYQP
ncbi:MAG: hypothetical protein E4H01_14530, partial [Lysobacterales bacterium]